MKNKKLETLLYSAIGVVIMFVIIVAVNAFAGAFRARLDFTQDSLHTLDAGTKAILKKLDAPVEIRFYFSRSEVRMPSGLKTYATHVEDLLADLRQASGNKLIIKKLDPKPDSEAEEMATLDGIEPQALQFPALGGDHYYLGMAISMEPVKATLPVLSPAREKLLEYDIARAIAQVMSTNKPVVGVMTPLPMFGMPMNPMMARMGQQGGQDPWVFLSELKRDFDVRQVPMETEKIEDDIKVLLVVHPKDIKDSAQYAIDQFLMRGGKLIAMLDPLCLADRQQANPMMGMPPMSSSNLEKLLKAWGISFDTTKVLADMKFSKELPVSRGGQPQKVPTYLFLDRNGIDQKDVATSQLDELLLPLAGVFSGTPATGLKQTVLLKSSAEAQLVEPFMANMAPQKIADDFKASGSTYTIAMRLTGKFKTAFPDGKPAEPKADENKDEKDKKEEKKPDPTETLKESKVETAVTLIGDADFIFDNFCARITPFFNQKIIEPQFGNLTMAQALVEQLAGDSNLIGARSRASLNRPFLKIKDMQAEANKRFQETIKKLEAEQQEAQKQLNELQGKKEAGQRFILTKEQQELIVKFRQKEADARKKLKEVRKDLSKEIDSLQNRLKWINIGAMPLAVTLAGLCLALVRKQKTKAK